MRLESFRVLICFASLFAFDLCQIDVLTANIHGGIDREVYMEPPSGYENGNY